MFVIAGLGNPGRAYIGTRHNAGFMVIDHLAAQHGIKVGRLKHRALTGEGLIGGQKAILVKPQTYMNLSGLSLSQLVSYYKVQPEQMLVIYDDMDIDVGRIRIRKNGGSGTHNGMRSIVAQLGTEGFPRIRVGIGKAGHEETVDFVLNRVAGAERLSLQKAVAEAAEAVEAILSFGIDKAMNEYNRKDRNGDIQTEKSKVGNNETE